MPCIHLVKEHKCINTGPRPTRRYLFLRPSLMVGLQEYALIPAQLDVLAQGKSNIQLRDNNNLIDLVSSDNCTSAHLLALHALLVPSRANGKVDGEAFNITDDNPLPFWDVARDIWRAAGDTTELTDVKVIPGWVANIMASVAEFAFRWVFFSSQSPELNRHVVNICTNTYTYDISKAKKILGYRPEKRTREVLKEATEWEIERRRMTSSMKGVEEIGAA